MTHTPQNGSRHTLNKDLWLSMGPYPIYVAIVLNRKEYDNVIRHLKVPDPSPFITTNIGEVHHFSHSNGMACAVLMLDGKKLATLPLSTIVSTVAHEAVHVWQAARDKICERSPATEQEAWFVDYVVGAVFDRLKPYLRKKVIKW